MTWAWFGVADRHKKRFDRGEGVFLPCWKVQVWFSRAEKALGVALESWHWKVWLRRAIKVRRKSSAALRVPKAEICGGEGAKCVVH